jgi:hypothetical protein
VVAPTVAAAACAVVGVAAGRGTAALAAGRLGTAAGFGNAPVAAAVAAGAGWTCALTLLCGAATARSSNRAMVEPSARLSMLDLFSREVPGEAPASQEVFCAVIAAATAS